MQISCARSRGGGVAQCTRRRAEAGNMAALMSLTQVTQPFKVFLNDSFRLHVSYQISLS